jgi:hypothetical protein
LPDPFKLLLNLTERSLQLAGFVVLVVAKALKLTLDMLGFLEQLAALSIEVPPLGRSRAPISLDNFAMLSLRAITAFQLGRQPAHGFGLVAVAEFAPQPGRGAEDLGQLTTVGRPFADHVGLVVATAFEHDLTRTNRPFEQLDRVTPLGLAEGGSRQPHDLELTGQRADLGMFGVGSLAVVAYLAFAFSALVAFALTAFAGISIAAYFAIAFSPFLPIALGDLAVAALGAGVVIRTRRPDFDPPDFVPFAFLGEGVAGDWGQQGHQGRCGQRATPRILKHVHGRSSFTQGCPGMGPGGAKNSHDDEDCRQDGAGEGEEASSARGLPLSAGKPQQPVDAAAQV